MVNGKPLFNMVVPNISVRSMTHNLCCYWLTAVDQAIQTLSPIPLLLKKVRALFFTLVWFYVCYEDVAKILTSMFWGLGTKRYEKTWIQLHLQRPMIQDSLDTTGIRRCQYFMCKVDWQFSRIMLDSLTFGDSGNPFLP